MGSFQLCAAVSAANQIASVFLAIQLGLASFSRADYLFMAHEPGFADVDLHALRLAVVGGAPMPETLLEAWHERGVEIVQGYGLTEAAPNVLCLPPEDAARKRGFAGKPYPHVDVALRDPETVVQMVEDLGMVDLQLLEAQAIGQRGDETALRQGQAHLGQLGLFGDGLGQHGQRLDEPLIAVVAEPGLVASGIEQRLRC